DLALHTCPRIRVFDFEFGLKHASGFRLDPKRTGRIQLLTLSSDHERLAGVFAKPDFPRLNALDLTGAVALEGKAADLALPQHAERERRQIDLSQDIAEIVLCALG